MTDRQPAPSERQLPREDRRLVDLVDAGLMDPSLHTDLRLRLSGEIAALLQGARAELSPPGGAAHKPVAAARVADPANLLSAVLEDPNLDTDLRLRLHREISDLLASAPARQ
jgi:hypothetical protein